MRCPYCGQADAKVLETRTDSSGLVVRRRRRCPGCEQTFWTDERLDTAPLRVVKGDNTREDFDRKRLLDSIDVGSKDLDLGRREEIVDRVVEKLGPRGPLVRSEEIGELALEELRQADAMAFARFALFFKRPKGLPEFSEWLKEKLSFELREAPREPLLIRSSDGQVRPFHHARLRQSITKAARGRSSTGERDIDRAVTKVFEAMKEVPDPSVDDLRACVVAVLKDLDHVVALSYVIAHDNLDSLEQILATAAAIEQEKS